MAGLLALAGCSGDPGATANTGTYYPVSGQVLLPDGKPLSGGKVVFLPKGGENATSSGEVGPDGKFSLKPPGGKEGLPPGQYKVRIDPPPAMLAHGPRGEAKPLPFSSNYTDIDGDTGLEATVKDGPTSLEPFKLTPPAKKKADGRG